MNPSGSLVASGLGRAQGAQPIIAGAHDPNLPPTKPRRRQRPGFPLSIIADRTASQERQLMCSSQETPVGDDESNRREGKKRVGSAPFGPHEPTTPRARQNLMGHTQLDSSDCVLTASLLTVLTKYGATCWTTLSMGEGRHLHQARHDDVAKWVVAVAWLGICEVCAIWSWTYAVQAASQLPHYGSSQVREHRPTSSLATLDELCTGTDDVAQLMDVHVQYGSTSVLVCLLPIHHP